jgi:hypothetical protein
MTTDQTAPTLGDIAPDRLPVRFLSDSGDGKPSVIVGDHEVRDYLAGIQIIADPIMGTRVQLEVPQHRLDRVEFEGLAVVEINTYADDPGPAAAAFLSAIDAGELEKAALARLDLDSEEHATTRAILRQLIEWANGEGGV